MPTTLACLFWRVVALSGSLRQSAYVVGVACATSSWTTSTSLTCLSPVFTAPARVNAEVWVKVSASTASSAFSFDGTTRAGRSPQWLQRSHLLVAYFLFGQRLRSPATRRMWRFPEAAQALFLGSASVATTSHRQWQCQKFRVPRRRGQRRRWCDVSLTPSRIGLGSERWVLSIRL